MEMKAIWSGTIHFGLLYIPVNLYTITKERRPDFTLIRKKDHCPISNIRVCKDTQEEVPYNQITRGYEYKDGEYIEVTDKDLQRVDREENYSIQILDFTTLSEISPTYFEKPYLVQPNGQEHGFVLLQKALIETGKAAIVKFRITTQENLGLLFVRDNTFFLNQIRYSSQFRKTEPQNYSENISTEELEAAMHFINQLSTPFELENYKDTFYQNLKKTIAAKVEGKTIRPKAKKPVPTPENELLQRLQQSIDYANRGLFH